MDKINRLRDWKGKKVSLAQFSHIQTSAFSAADEHSVSPSHNFPFTSQGAICCHVAEASRHIKWEREPTWRKLNPTNWANQDHSAQASPNHGADSRAAIREPAYCGGRMGLTSDREKLSGKRTLQNQKLYLSDVKKTLYLTGQLWR